jgi:hypothetical protein
MRLLVVLSAVAAALAIVPSASPGGWATVGFEPLPDGTSAGGTWSPLGVVALALLGGALFLGARRLRRLTPASS